MPPGRCRLEIAGHVIYPAGLRASAVIDASGEKGHLGHAHLTPEERRTSLVLATAEGI